MAADISFALLEKARAAEDANRLGMRYVRLDVSSPDALAGETFDVVVSHFGLSDIDDLDGTFATVSRLLPAGGRCVFSVLRPCFSGWGKDAPSSWEPEGGYYAEGWWLADNSGFRGKVGGNHRMLSTYLNGLIQHRLESEHVAEPKPAGEWTHSKPGAPVPVYLVARCRRR